ncbi:MAG: hypothetical protein DRP11_04230 [Candidatus Aenigmatarchaeota archaeon]|nr:MAG: hypothetical protein DRP11_04230 [Candidatus Aenigmarchaeota archaeon]
MKELFIILLLVSAIFIGGCTQPLHKAPTTTGNVEDQAMSEIEQEMESAIENMTLEDIEAALLE